MSEISKVLEVRELLVSQQRKIGKNKAIVMDGRDIGTVVFPHAELKIFMTASPEIRAKRRFEELKSKNEKVSYNEVLKNIISRDREDSNRNNSPLVKAYDAIIIDNSDITKKEQFEIVISLAKKKIK